MRRAFTDKPSSVTTHILVVVAYALGEHRLLAVLFAYQHHLGVGYAHSLVTVDAHGLLAVDVIHGGELVEKSLETLRQFLAPL